MRSTAKYLSGILVVLAAGMASADVLVLRDGTRLEGRVEAVGNNRDRVAFISGNGRIEITRDRITEIIEESDAQDWTHVGNQFLRARNHSAAVQMYQRALEADSEFGPARDGMAEAQAAIAAQQDERVRQLQEAVGAQLEQISTMLEKEAYDEARYQRAERDLNQILDSDASDQQRVTAQRLMLDLFLKWGFARYDRLDSAGAEERYLRVLEMDPNNNEARDALLRIWRNDPTKKPQVLEAYQAKLREEPNNLEFNRIVGDMLYEAQRYEESIPMLTKVESAPRFANQGYTAKLRNAYQGAIMDARDRRNLEKAISLMEQQLQIFPNMDTTELTVLRYDLAKSRLAPDDWESRGALVGRLQEIGLTQMAAREAELVLRYDPENQAANAVLREQAVRELQEVQAAMQMGQFLVARSSASNFMRSHSRYPDLLQQAQELFNLADIEAKKQQQANRQMAEQIATRGLQYYQEAQRFVQLMSDTNVRSDARPISFKQEAITLTQRSITHMEEALRIDPTLGGMDGMDLNARLRDARVLYNGLTDRPTPLPRQRNR